MNIAKNYVSLFCIVQWSSAVLTLEGKHTKWKQKKPTVTCSLSSIHNDRLFFLGGRIYMSPKRWSFLFAMPTVKLSDPVRAEWQNSYFPAVSNATWVIWLIIFGTPPYVQHSSLYLLSAAILRAIVILSHPNSYCLIHTIVCLNIMLVFRMSIDEDYAVWCQIVNEGCFTVHSLPQCPSLSGLIHAKARGDG